MKICLFCGKKLELSMFRDKSEYGRAKFCNRTCYLAFHATRYEVRFCELCGASFKWSARWKWTKKFCSKKCRYLAAKKHGTTYISGNGYVYIKDHSHPDGRKTKGYVLLHRVIAECMLGRRLRSGEVVHHKNGNTQDNRPENLRIYQSHKEHFDTHGRGYHGWLLPAKSK